MTPDEIRALYVETLAQVLKPVTEPGCCDECDHKPIVHGYLDADELVDALAEAGLLPDRQEETVSEHNEIGRRFVTAWKKVGELVVGAARYASEVSE